MLDALANRLRNARALVALTGAGVSAESGIPTFRDPLRGLWAQFRPEDLATPEAFARDPTLVARWYDERRARCAACRPNPGHTALARLERDFTASGREFVLLTQNVDRLHQRAGSQNVVELHGTLWIWRCTRCGEEREEPRVPFDTYPPLCECGG
jgi:NAD-dependent deacetylase